MSRVSGGPPVDIGPRPRPDVVTPSPCCDIHRDGSVRPNGMAHCCDPNDCGPCCPECPTCPSIDAVGLTPARRQAMVERLHKAWHPAPNACSPHRSCYERRRAVGTVRILGPLLTRYLVEDIEQAKAELAREWGE